MASIRTTARKRSPEISWPSSPVSGSGDAGAAGPAGPAGPAGDAPAWQSKWRKLETPRAEPQHLTGGPAPEEAPAGTVEPEPPIPAQAPGELLHREEPRPLALEDRAGRCPPALPLDAAARLWSQTEGGRALIRAAEQGVLSGPPGLIRVTGSGVEHIPISDDQLTREILEAIGNWRSENPTSLTMTSTGPDGERLGFHSVSTATTPKVGEALKRLPPEAQGALERIGISSGRPDIENVLTIYAIAQGVADSPQYGSLLYGSLVGRGFPAATTGLLFPREPELTLPLEPEQVDILARALAEALEKSPAELHVLAEEILSLRVPEEGEELHIEFPSGEAERFVPGTWRLQLSMALLIALELGVTAWAAARLYRKRQDGSAGTVDYFALALALGVGVALVFAAVGPSAG